MQESRKLSEIMGVHAESRGLGTDSCYAEPVRVSKVDARMLFLTDTSIQQSNLAEIPRTKSGAVGSLMFSATITV